MFIPAKLVKVRIEGDWRGKGFVESMLAEEQESGLKIVNIICQALHKLYVRGEPCLGEYRNIFRENSQLIH